MDYKSWCALGSMLQNLIPIGFSNTLPRNNKINDTSLLEKEWPYTALNRGISLLSAVKNSSTFGAISINDKIFFYTCIRPLCSLADCCNGVPATCRWDALWELVSPLHNVLFGKYVYLATKQAETYLICVLIYHLTYICPSLFDCEVNTFFLCVNSKL